MCHHSVVARESAFYVGALRFDTIGEVIEYFRDHPLGDMTLKEEVNYSTVKCIVGWQNE